MSRDEETELLNEFEQAKLQLGRSLKRAKALIVECKARISDARGANGSENRQMFRFDHQGQRD